MSPRSLVRDFTDYTTAHGLPSIKRAESCPGKGIWVVFVLMAWTALTYQIYVAIYAYFLYETTVSVQVTHSNDISFPAVTVCNLNAVRQTKVEKLPAFDSMMEKLQKTTTQAGWGGASAKRSMTLTAEQQKKAIYHYSLYKFNVDLAQFGHRLKDMMVECTFQGMQCYPNNFTRWAHATYGNCYTLFVPKGGYPSFVGPDYGLALTLYTQDEEYMHAVTPAAGFRVVVHSPEYVPFPEDQGFTISPGYLSSVAFKQRYIHRQPLPYDNTDCGISDHSQLNSRYMKLWEEFEEDGLISKANYSNAACTKDCYQQTLLDKCGCVDADTITRKIVNIESKETQEKNAMVKGDPVPPCDLTDDDVLKCVLTTTLEINKNGTCDYPTCLQSCDEYNIITRITSSLWPLESYYDDNKANWEQRLGINLAAESHTTALYFEELNFESIVESAAMDIWSLLSSVGGTMGLYGGLSFLTLIEIVELFVWIISGKEGKNQYAGCFSFGVAVQQKNRTPCPKAPIHGNF